MKRTIATSFLFIIPINYCALYGHLFHLNLTAVCLGLSIANHSHSFYTHHDKLRRKGINFLDQFFSSFNTCYSFYMGLTSLNCYLYGVTNLLIITTIFIRYLLPIETEKYTPAQKTLHALWHCIAILGLTHYNLLCAT